ncbi:fibronectin type III domain protein [Ostertagia ostertagi]
MSVHPLFQRTMLHLYLLLVLLQTTSGFIVLPYIQIDYAHYFRLAQCQAKCTEKYGVLSTRVLLDGSAEEFLDTRNPDCEACESGCHQHRRLRGRGQHGPASSPLQNGLRFWAESSADSAKAGSTVMSSIQMLCQNPIVDDEYGETVEAFVSISLLRPAGPTRYVVQWRQRNQAIGNRDETQWITASVEPDTFIKVKGLVPGVQYRFMVTAVGPTGRLGETISSPWTEIASTTLKAPAGPLTLKNGYNSDRGVIAQLEWPRSAQDSCYYKLQLSNSSTQISRDIVLDSSPSILLPHLEFDVDYTIAIAAVSADKLQTSKAVTTNFKSLPCRDIHGRGSLQCAPEPVSDLAIVVRPNGTGLISWTPSADSQNILFYQIIYHALSRNNGCRLRKETVNIKAVEREFRRSDFSRSTVRIRGSSDQLRPDRTRRILQKPVFSSNPRFPFITSNSLFVPNIFTIAACLVVSAVRSSSSVLSSTSVSPSSVRKTTETHRIRLNQEDVIGLA